MAEVDTAKEMDKKDRLDKTNKLDVRLIAADLDGTLLNERKEVSERNLAALYRAAERGILFVPATGRIWRGLPQALLALPFLKYAIAVNGAGVVDCEKDETLHRAEISREDSVRIAEYMRGIGTYFDCYLDGKGCVEQSYYDRIDEFIRENFRPFIRSSRETVPDLIEFLKTQNGVQKLQMNFADMELRARVMKEIPEIFPEVAVTTAVVNNVEVNAADGNKGCALEWLCQYLGIDLSQVAAFGDGTNDITMLQTAGVSVAMGNALPEVKAAAKYETVTNEEDGVAVFLESYVL